MQLIVTASVMHRDAGKLLLGDCCSHYSEPADGNEIDGVFDLLLESWLIFILGLVGLGGFISGHSC